MCASSVPVDVESDGKEARVSTAPPNAATVRDCVAQAGVGPKTSGFCDFGEGGALFGATIVADPRARGNWCRH